MHFMKLMDGNNISFTDNQYQIYQANKHKWVEPKSYRTKGFVQEIIPFYETINVRSKVISEENKIKALTNSSQIPTASNA